MTDPEESFSEDEEFDAVTPLEAEPADALDQQRELPEDDEEDYR